MSVTASTPPSRNRPHDGCLFYTLTTAQERHAMQAQPGQWFQLRDDRRDSLVFPDSDLSALYGWGRKHGWKFTARAVEGGNHVWVTYRPQQGDDAS